MTAVSRSLPDGMARVLENASVSSWRTRSQEPEVSVRPSRYQSDEVTSDAILSVQLGSAR